MSHAAEKEESHEQWRTAESIKSCLAGVAAAQSQRAEGKVQVAGRSGMVCCFQSRLTACQFRYRGAARRKGPWALGEVCWVLLAGSYGRRPLGLGLRGVGNKARNLSRL